MKTYITRDYILGGEYFEHKGALYQAVSRDKRRNCCDQCMAKDGIHPHCIGLCYKFMNDDVVFVRVFAPDGDYEVVETEFDKELREER